MHQNHRVFCETAFLLAGTPSPDNAIPQITSPYEHRLIPSLKAEMDRKFLDDMHCTAPSCRSARAGNRPSLPLS